MQILPRHPLEKERLEALRSYQILDTLEETDFDELTALASVICDVPIALVSLIDKDRQWFKSHHGVPIKETPLEQSFCAHSIVSAEAITVVEDPNSDNRFKDNPLVTGDPHIAFYAGVPLINEDGFPLGTLCILDLQKRHLTEHQQTALKILAKQVMDKLELRKKIQILRATEQQLQLANKELALVEAQLIRQVAERTSDLQRSNEDLEQFAHVASHDLKEPVRKVRMFTDQLRQTAHHLLPEDSQRSLEKIQRAAERMQAMIEGVLTYSQQLAAHEEMQIVNLDDLLGEVCTDLELLISEQGAVIRRSSLGTVEGSATQLHQLIYNLLINALKFSREHRQPVITIQASAIEQEGKAMKKLILTDNGIGFEPAYAQQIFQPFTRLHSKDQYEGTGMGLALCRKIVLRHGGTIYAEGSLDRGAVFTITLPLKQQLTSRPDLVGEASC
jgi:signal transduction histidine kinase